MFLYSYSTEDFFLLLFAVCFEEYFLLVFTNHPYPQPRAQSGPSRARIIPPKEEEDVSVQTNVTQFTISCITSLSRQFTVFEKKSTPAAYKNAPWAI